VLFWEVAEREEFMRHVAKDELVVVAIDGGVCVPTESVGRLRWERDSPRAVRSLVRPRWSPALGPG
jgi:hypothetical protein